MTLPTKPEILAYLGDHWTRNKAVGALAELLFQSEIVQRHQVEKKIVDGCWIFTPHLENFYDKRVAFFLHRIDRLKETQCSSFTVAPPVIQAAQYLRKLGVKSCYAIPDAGTVRPR